MAVTASAANVKEFFEKGKKVQTEVDKILKSNGQKVTEIKWTKDYKIFKRLKGNRPVIEAHVRQLAEMFRVHEIPVPVLVNEKLEIVDGQHTLEGREELKLEVPYMVVPGLSLSDVQMLNSTSKSWLPEDYARSYVEQGNKHYVTYTDFRRTYGLHHDISVILLAGRGPNATRNAFRMGEFKVHDLDGALKMANILHSQLKPIWPNGWRDTSFLRALHIATTRPGFQMERFLRAANENRHLLSVYRKVDTYLLMIEEIYNAVAGGKLPIRFAKSLSGAAAHGNAWAKKRKEAKEAEPVLKPAKKREIVVIKKGAK